MSVSILAPDGSRAVYNATEGFSILGPDGALMPNDGSNGISILGPDGAYMPFEPGNSYSILDQTGALRPHEPGNTYSILDAMGALAQYDTNTLLNLVAMFAGNEQGWVYDISDFSSLYQDHQGKDRVVGLEQIVGMVLDKRFGTERGPELWSHANAVVSGESQILGVQSYRIYSSVGNASYVNNPSALVVGKTYEVSFNIDSVTDAGGGLGVGDTGVTFPPAEVTVGPKRKIFLANATAAFIKRIATIDVNISNVSFKEVGVSLGPELLVDGELNNGITAPWYQTGSGWAANSGSVYHTAGVAANLVQDVGVVNGVYDITYTVTETNGFNVGAYAGTSVSYTSTVGTFTARLTATQIGVGIRAQSGFEGRVTNVSVKRVLSGGNHLIQPTSTQRGVVSARINHLYPSENFSSWTKRGVTTITPFADTAPDGTNSANLFTDVGIAAANDAYDSQYALAGRFPNSVPLALRVYIKKVTPTGVLRISNANNSSNGRWDVDLSLLSDSWEEVTAAHPAVTIVFPMSSTATGQAALIVSSSAGLLTFYMWGTHAEVGTVLHKYQRTGVVKNLMTYTDILSNGAWVLPWAGTGVLPIITDGYATAPDGKKTTTRIVASKTGTSSGNYSLIQQSITHSGGSANYTASVWLKSNTGLPQNVYLRMGTDQYVTVTGEWQRFVLTEGRSSGAVYVTIGVRGTSDDNIDILAWHPQLELGTVATDYEWVHTATTTYDSAGFPIFIRLNGLDDWYQTAGNVDLTGIEKFSVGSAITKMNDIGLAVLTEFSSNINSFQGAFGIFAPVNAAANYGIRLKGDAGSASYDTTAVYPAPRTDVVYVDFDISGVLNSEIMPRINGVIPPVGNTGGGITGTFLSYPFYWFSRGGLSGFLQGNFYGSIGIARNFTASERQQVEKWLARKAGITI